MHSRDPLAGRLACNGASKGDAFRMMGIYAGRILNGNRPSDLPVQQVTRLDSETGKTLGIAIPLPLIGRCK